MTEAAQKEQPNNASASQPGEGAGGDDSNRKVVTLGLVPSPELAERVASEVAEDLPDLLSVHVDNQVSWKVASVTDPLTGSNVEASELLEEVHQRAQAGGWDYAICLTDLPIRREKRILIADVSIERNIAWISLPALGVVRLRSRIRSAILQLVSEMRWGTPHGDGSHQQGRDEHEGEASGERDRAPSNLIARQVARQIAAPDEDMDVDVRYAAPRIIGHARLLAGMVFANSPWTLLPSFKTTVATAFATGAYGLIFTTLWRLGDAYTLVRLVTLMVAAMTILIAWIILSHNLWEPHMAGTSPYLTTLYNTATVLTIMVGVVFAYVMVFLLLLVAEVFFVPASMLESTLQHPAMPMDYVKIAWVTASVATVAGAVGAGLEDTEAVRDSTFGWRQQRRFEEYETSSEKGPS